MKTYIALLRGINVGGHRKVPMAELRELLTKIGLSNVKSYIQSGNVIFKVAETNILTKTEPVFASSEEKIELNETDDNNSEDENLSIIEKLSPSSR